jgi:hypothetical protein
MDVVVKINVPVPLLRIGKTVHSSDTVAQAHCPQLNGRL